MRSGAQSSMTLSIEAIAKMVQDHVPESFALEFKATLDLTTKEAKRDIVCDIAAFANASGGSIIIGISERGMSRHAADWGQLTAVDAESIRQTILGLCGSHIEPAIPGLDIQTEVMPGKASLVVINIPAGSLPHAVTGFDQEPKYYKRVGDGKLPMTPADLQAAFARASSRRDTPEPRDDFPNGRSAVEEALQEAQEKAEDRPFFFIAGASVALHADALDLQSQELQQILAENADGNTVETMLGWVASNAKLADRSIVATVGSYTFSLREDGLMAWVVQVSDGAHFFQSWREDCERVFNQYAIVGYPLSFARSFCALRGIMKRTSGPYVMQMAYSGCQDITLYPGHIGLERYSSTSVSWDVDKGRTSEQLIKAPFEPKEFNSLLPADRIARDLLKHFYQAFGYSQEAIPFWDDTAKVFDLDSEQHR